MVKAAAEIGGTGGYLGQEVMGATNNEGRMPGPAGRWCRQRGPPADCSTPLGTAFPISRFSCLLSVVASRPHPMVKFISCASGGAPRSAGPAGTSRGHKTAGPGRRARPKGQAEDKDKA